MLTLAGIHIGKGQLDSAHHYLAMADSLEQIEHLPLYSAKGNIELDYYHYLYQRASGDVPGALASLENALRTAQQGRLIRFAQKYRRELALLYHDRGSIQEAWEQQLTYAQVNDSLQKQADRQKVAAYERDMKERLNEQEIQRQHTELKQQRVVLYAAGSVSLLLVVLALVVVRNNRSNNGSTRILDQARQCRGQRAVQSSSSWPT
ncbi:MAG: hypothetical protein IPL52_05975 [Flavobacteriales bacterium]|nr:hypothetical protein [Flavobacteriales bacterium]